MSVVIVKLLNFNGSELHFLAEHVECLLISAVSSCHISTDVMIYTFAIHSISGVPLLCLIRDCRAKAEMGHSAVPCSLRLLTRLRPTLPLA